MSLIRSANDWDRAPAELAPGLLLHLDEESRSLDVVIDRPEQRNAITIEMWRSLPSIFAAVEQDDRIRSVVVRSSDARSFSAGADVHEFDRVRSTPELAQDYSLVVLEAERAIEDCSKPTIALVQGWCVGGGCEIALACDIRIATPDACFAITPAKLGIVYSQTSTRRLVAEVGPAWARYLLLTSNFVDAETALRCSLVHDIVPQHSAFERLRELLVTIASRAPVSLAASKVLIRRSAEANMEDTIASEWYARSYVSEDYDLGRRAFVTRTAPDFSQIPWPRLSDGIRAEDAR